MNYNQYGGYAPHYRGGCGHWGHKRWGQRHFRSAPVNIEEKEDRFELLVYAPSLVKENIKVTAKDDILTISYSAPETGEATDNNYTRREYHQQSFERSFVLNGKVDVEKITASYRDGILKVMLPKNPATNKPAQEVEIS